MFEHQVGGHSACMTIGDDRISKPLKSGELRFYCMIPDRSPPLMHFLPTFYGSSFTHIIQYDAYVRSRSCCCRHCGRVAWIECR